MSEWNAQKYNFPDRSSIKKGGAMPESSTAE